MSPCTSVTACACARTQHVSKSCDTTYLKAVWRCRYDPDPNATVIEEDEDLLESYLLVPEADFHPELHSPWLLRIELDKMMMLDKRLECAHVANTIASQYYGMVHVIASEDNAEKLVLRLRLVAGGVCMSCLDW